MDEKLKYKFILIGSVLSMILSLITLLTILFKSIVKADQKMRDQSTVVITPQSILITNARE